MTYLKNDRDLAKVDGFSLKKFQNREKYLLLNL